MRYPLRKQLLQAREINLSLSRNELRQGEITTSLRYSHAEIEDAESVINIIYRDIMQQAC